MRDNWGESDEYQYFSDPLITKYMTDLLTQKIQSVQIFNPKNLLDPPSWGKNTLGYLSADIIYAKKGTVS